VAGSSVTSIITRAQIRYPELGSSIAQQFFNDAHHFVLEKLQVRNTTSTVSLTANTQQYDLDATISKVHEAYYERSSEPGTWQVLYEKSLDQLIVESKGWRTTGTSNIPYYYYITSATDTDSGKPQIGFYPIPNAGTSGTYPRVKLYVTQYADLTGSETVPSSLLDDKIYVYQICRDWASGYDKDLYGWWQERVDEEVQKNIIHVRNMQSFGDDFTIKSPFSSAGRVV
jgi:hypothetical protein